MLTDMSESENMNILVTRTDRLGDVILTLPLITHIKKNFPSAKLYFLVSRYVKDLIENYEGIEELIFIEDFPTINSLKKFLKTEKFNVVINVFPRFKLAFAFFVSGIKIRIGSGYRWYSFLYNRKIYEHRKFADKHEADYNLNLLIPLVDNIEYDKKFYFNYSQSEFLELKNKLNKINFDISGKFIIVHPSSKGSALDLPLEKFKNLCSEILINFKDFNIVLTGTRDEHENIKRILISVNDQDNRRIYDFAGIMNLKELMILIDNSKLFISNSTGPIHIAGALNKNIIGFYPDRIPMNAERWRPLSKNAVIIKPEVAGEMDSISIEKVIDSVRSILNKKID